MTFKQWVLNRKGENSPIGDFALDIYYDKEFPDSKNYSKIKTYLEESRASDIVLDIFENAWIEYAEEVNR